MEFAELLKEIEFIAVPITLDDILRRHLNSDEMGMLRFSLQLIKLFEHADKSRHMVLDFSDNARSNYFWSDGGKVLINLC